MALINCKECNNEVSTTAKTCPKCGAKIYKVKKPAGRVGTFLIIAAGLGIIISLVLGAQSNQAESAKSPEQKEAEAKQKALTSQRDSITILALQNIKKNLRNPDSVKWGKILANDDGSVICIDYRAQNGFGGMTLEQIAFINGKANTTTNTWNKKCAEGSLNDVSDALRYLN